MNSREDKMAETNNVDMFKLVEQVEKQKSERDANLDSIFSDLDALTNTDGGAKQVTIPSIPNHIGSYLTRYDCFKAIIEHVSYGTSNVKEYMNGHKDALNKYYVDVNDCKKDLSVLERKVSQDIQNYGSHDQLYEKGYYDGMLYVLKAIKRSKELIMKEMADKLSLVL